MTTPATANAPTVLALNEIVGNPVVACAGGSIESARDSSAPDTRALCRSTFDVTATSGTSRPEVTSERHRTSPIPGRPCDSSRRL